MFFDSTVLVLSLSKDIFERSKIFFNKFRTSAILFVCFNNIAFQSPSFVEYCIVDTLRKELYPHTTAQPYRACMMHVWIPRAEHKQQYPLILFSHGLGKTYNGMTYTNLCKNIASRGYVVASVSHTYACKPVQFLDDSTQTPYLFPSRAVHFQSNKHMFDIETDMWVTDMIYALDECARYNVCEDNPLYDVIDMSRIGIVGHSLGGATALQVCRCDDRVTVAVNLDGPLYGTDCHMPFDKPMLCIFGSSVLPGQIREQGIVPHHAAFLWRYCCNTMWLPALNKFIASSPQIETITIDGIIHDTFSDYAFTPDLAIQKWLLDGAQAQEMICKYVCDFLDRYFLPHSKMSFDRLRTSA
jgi:dienelactone hydrolase